MKITNQSENLFEVTHSASLQVNTESGVISGVKILGTTSANGRSYSPDAMRRAAGLYEGMGVFTDHPPRSTPNVERKVGDRLGWLESVQVRDDGLYGTLNVLKSHPLANSVFESAERNPRLLGLSHNASGKTRRVNGKVIVEEIDNVRSVDLVTDPATTNGLFESKEIPMKRTLREVCEHLKELPAAKMLLEMTEDDAALASAADAPVEEPAEAPAGDQMKAAFRAAVMAAFDDEGLDTKATLKKIGEVLKAYEKLNAKPEAESAPDAPADSDDAEDKKEDTPESKDLAAKLAKLQARDNARDLLEAAGVVPGDAAKREAMIESLAALSSDSQRESLLETWRGTGAPEKPAQKPRSGGFRESRETSSLPTDRKELLAHMKRG